MSTPTSLTNILMQQFLQKIHHTLSSPKHTLKLQRTFQLLHQSAQTSLDKTIQHHQPSNIRPSSNPSLKLRSTRQKPSEPLVKIPSERRRGRNRRKIPAAPASPSSDGGAKSTRTAIQIVIRHCAEPRGEMAGADESWRWGDIGVTRR